MNERMVRTGSWLICFALTPTLHAQTQRSGGGESQKILQQYQQLAAEKTALQAQVAQLKRDLEGAQAETAAAKKERDALKARSTASATAAAQLAQATAARQSAEKNLEQTKQRTTDLVDRFKLTIGSLKSVEADRTELQKANSALAASYDKCAIANSQLYDISSTVLDRYEHVGFFTKVGDVEPFTRITRTRIDNLVDEYRARAEELRVKKATP